MSDCENAHLMQIDLPQLSIPEDLEHSSTSDYDSNSATTPSLASPPESPSGPSTPTTQVSQLGGGISAFGFSDSDESPSTPISTPKSRKSAILNGSLANIVASFVPI